MRSTATDALGSWPGWQYTAGGTTYGVKNDADSTNDGYAWGTTNGQLEIDIQHAFQTVRRALTSAQTIYTTMTGYSYYYVGIGGEIGYDAANQFPNSIPLSSKPFTAEPEATRTSNRSSTAAPPAASNTSARVDRARTIGGR